MQVIKEETMILNRHLSCENVRRYILLLVLSNEHRLPATAGGSPASMGWGEDVTQKGKEGKKMRYFGTIPLKTEHLELRRYIKEDADNLYETIGCDPMMDRFVTWKPWKTRQGSEEFIELHLQEYRSNLAFFGWAIAYEGKCIGSIGTYHLDEHKQECEVGYNIARAYWGRGFATEALDKVLQFLFEQIDLKRVYASFHEQNIASMKVLEKVGMKEEKIERGKREDGKQASWNLVYYEILKQDWKSLYK